MKPYFTVIIPTLNEEGYIGSLLSDLNKQKYTDFEVIIIDGNSDDKTKNVARNCRRSFPLIFHRVTKRQVSFQRNKGSELAHGSYLIFLDADVHIQRAFLQNIYHQIQKQKGLFFIPEIVPSVRDPQIKMIFEGVNAAIRMSQTLGKPFSSGGSMIIERHFFYRLGGFSEKAFMSEDHQLVQEAYRYGVHAKFSPNIKLSFSLRRFNKEGKFKVLYKYVVNTIHFLSKGKVDKKICEYEMGGHLYKGDKKKRFVFEDIIKVPLKQFRAAFYDLFEE